MGFSVSAVLCYGFAAPQDDEEEDNPWEDVDERVNEEEWQMFSPLHRELGVELCRHNHWDYPIYVLEVRAARQEAGTGEIKALDSGRLAVQPEWEQNLRTFAARCGLDLGDAQPGWFLVTHWS